MSATIQLQGKDGKPVDMKVDLSLYSQAAANKRDVRLEARFSAQEQGVAWDPSKGELLDQLYTASGLLDSSYGGNSLTMKDLQSQTLANGFRAPDGNDQAIGARVLFPQMILETLKANALDKDGSDIIAKWQDLVGITTNLNGKRADQPIINTSGPEDSPSGRIAQMAEPETMISITTGEKSYKVPTYSVGLLISDEAREATSVDLVKLVMEAQGRGERIRRISEQLKAMVLGDEDLGMAPLETVKANTFDTSIVAANKLTKKAYIKWLMHNKYNANLTRILTGIDEALLVDDQLSPIHTGSDNSKIATPYGGVDFGIPTPKFMTFEQEVFGAGMLVGLDPRYAIQRFVNVSAAYEAIEEYVMRKATGFRVDYGEMSTRLYDEAWSVLELSV